MELLEVVEVLVKNPFCDLSLLDNSTSNKKLVESYKNSDACRVRELLADKKEFADMSHVIPFADMSHVFPIVK